VGRLDGKVAIVTGGASGIGAATCRRFVAEGARVVVADVNDDAGMAFVRELGPDALFRHTDVGSLADVEAAVAIAVERFGGLDVLHNNAAWSGGGYTHTIDPDAWDRSIQVMLTGCFYGMKAAIPAMLTRGGGSIINTSSIEGIVAEIMAAPYNAAKAGLINLSRTVAIEYGRKGIRSNCICPGVVDTPLAAMLMAIAPKPRADIEAEHAIGRLIRPEEIANVALFLASDESSAVTGTAIVVDGGLIAKSPISGFPPFAG